MPLDFELILALVFRWLHILAAITAVGGTIFARVVVFPTLAPLPDEQRFQLHAALRERWATVVKFAIGFLLVSGLVNFLITVSQYRVPPWYHMVFGVKFLMAMAIFAIASLLIGKSPAAQAVRARAPLWLNLNIALAVAVVCLSGVLRTAEKSPKTLAVVPSVAPGRGLCENGTAPLQWPGDLITLDVRRTTACLSAGTASSSWAGANRPAGRL